LKDEAGDETEGSCTATLLELLTYLMVASKRESSDEVDDSAHDFRDETSIYLLPSLKKQFVKLKLITKQQATRQ